jgi:hypothetical protein
MKASSKSNNKRSRKPGNNSSEIAGNYCSSLNLCPAISEKAPEKSAEEVELEEFLFGKDIINSKAKKEEEEIEVIGLHVTARHCTSLTPQI